MSTVFLGDVHGNMTRCKRVAEQFPDSLVVQIGDLGVGFVHQEKLKSLGRRPNFRFFCGNHDCRRIAHTLPFHLGDYGDGGGFFFLSGAESMDKDARIEGISWWADEQLSMAQLQDAIDKWAKGHWDVLVSHDAPQSLHVGSHHRDDRNRTRLALDEMTRLRKPKLHIFGHHHISTRCTRDGVRYIGLACGSNPDSGFQDQGEVIVVDISPDGKLLSCP